jgi:hypothetical protein
MTVSAKTLEAINHETQKVPIADNRWPERPLS